MSIACDYAFALAYKSWLENDAHYWRKLGGQPEVLNTDWLRDIGRIFLVNRTIPAGAEESVIESVTGCGLDKDMALEERAARISLNMNKNGQTAVSAVSKISWFIWPSGWTMFDRLASRAVLGSSAGNTLSRFERFYVALSMRNWNDVLEKVRAVLRARAVQPLLAERTIDKYLMLVGMDEAGRERLRSAIDSFLAELPRELRCQLTDAGEEISDLLKPGVLLARGTKTDRRELTARLEQFQKFKSEIA